MFGGAGAPPKLCVAFCVLSSLGGRQPAALITLVQRSISLFTSAPKACGPLPDFSGSTLPSSSNRLRVVERIAQLVDNLLRCALGSEQRVPGLRLELRKSSLLSGRDVRQGRITRGRPDCVSLDLSALDLLHNVDNLVAHIVDLSSDQCRERRSRPII